MGYWPCEAERMARQVNRLSARTVATLTKPGRHADGAGLYLVVDPSGAKRWLFLFRWSGKLKEIRRARCRVAWRGQGEGRGGPADGRRRQESD